MVNGRKTLMVGGVAAVAVAITGTATACSNSSTQQASSSSASAPSSSAAAEAHNQADAMFTQRMIPHHQQAIEMSDMVLAKQGIDSRVTDLAKQIKAAQGPEIQQMQLVESVGHAHDADDAGHGGCRGMDMPGMGGSGGARPRVRARRRVAVICPAPASCRASP